MNRDRSHITYIPYARKSTEDDERQVQSIGDQEEWFAKAKAENGLATRFILSDSKSAKEPYKRDGFDEMVRAIRAGEANGILAWKFDRISRNPVESGMVAWLLQSGAIQSIVTSDREYLPGDNAIILSVEAGMANQYVRDLSKNVRRGLQSKLKKGWKPGRAPLGYLNTITKERGENFIKKDPKRFDAVKEAWDLMLTGGYSVAQVLAHLGEKWALNTPKRKRSGGKSLHLSALYKIFGNIFYAGLFEYAGKTYQGAHEPMITVDQFDRVQALLRRPDRPRSSHHTYSYTGLLACGACESSITATRKEKILKSTGKKAIYDFYFCVSAKKKTGCDQSRYLNEDKLDEQIEEILDRIAIHPEIAQWAVDILERDAEQDYALEAKAREAIKAKVDDLGKQLANLRDLRVRDLIEDDEFVVEQKRLADERTKSQARLAACRHEGRRIFEITKRALLFAGHAREAFGRGDQATKRAILRSLGPNRSLRDKNISIEAPKWITAIEKHRGIIRSRLDASEPGIWASADGRMTLHSSLFPMLCGLVDDVRNSLGRDSNLTKIADLRDSVVELADQATKAA